MSEKIIVEFRWTKTGDEEPNQRLVKLTQELPVVKTNEVADLLLQLPRLRDGQGKPLCSQSNGRPCYRYYYDSPQPLSAEPDFNQLARAIADLKNQVLMENTKRKEEATVKQRKQAQEEKEREKKQAEEKRQKQKVLAEIKPQVIAALANNDEKWLRKHIEIVAPCVGAHRDFRTFKICGVPAADLTWDLDDRDLLDRLEAWGELEVDRPKREKAEREERRKKYIADWAQQHGSDRLKKQVEQGFVGWPLYLHEKIGHDFGEIIENRKVVLDNNDSYEGEIDNPNLEYLEIGELVLQRIKKLEQELTIEYCRYRCDGNQDQYDAISIEDYRPGPKDAFEKTYNLRLRVSDYRSWMDEEG